MSAKAPARPAYIKPASAYFDGEVWRDGEYWFDERAASAAVRFFSDHLCLTEGEWAGRPFILEPWQENDVVRPVFGWKRADGTRRYRRCFVWVPRKNGKTELAAGLALLMLLGDGEPGGQVFSIALEKEQAAIVFNKAQAMVARSKTLQLAPPLGAGLECPATAIYWPEQNASFRPLSGKPQGKHGLNMSGLVGDEIHEWRNGDLYTFVHDSAAARRQPLEILISTAGVKGSYGEDVWHECQAILNGEVEEPSTLVVVYAADPEDDWTDPKVWAKANPNLGVSVKLDALAAEVRRAQQLPRVENDLKRYRLNIWTDQAVRWLPIDAVDDNGRRYGWKHCEGPISWRDLEAALRHKRCFGGLDLSSTTDLSALVWWFPRQEGLEVPAVLARFWKPASLVKEHSRRDRIPYDRFVDEGALIATPGNVVDYRSIREQIYRDAELFQIAFRDDADRDAREGGIGIDRWNATETAVELREEGLPVVLFGQGFGDMNAPAKELERLTIDNGFHHGGHPLLERHAKAVAVETNPAGDIKPSKENTRLRIDGIVAQTMALGLSLRDRAERSVITGADAVMVL